MKFSYFDNFYSKHAHKCELSSWQDFVEHLRQISEVPGYKPAVGEYDKQQGLISSAIYGDDIHRLNDNVIGWEILILDIDDGVDAMEQVLKKFSPFEYVIYSSANCTKEKLKLRVVIPLSKFAGTDDCKRIWYAMNEWCDGIIDKQTSDVARIHYIPARYTNKGEEYNHIFITNEGVRLNWEGLISAYPMPPEKDKFKINNPLRDLKRKVFLDAKSVPVMDITRSDCPFVYPKLIEEYRLTPAGGHHNAIYTAMVKIRLE